MDVLESPLANRAFDLGDLVIVKSREHVKGGPVICYIALLINNQQPARLVAYFCEFRQR